MAPSVKSMSARTPARSVYVALLRGVNVGGNKKVPMRDLAADWSDGGCTEVRTYIQSGNVVFFAPPESPKARPGRTPEETDGHKRLENLLSARIADRFGFPVPVVVRTADEFRQVVSRNPFLKTGADVASLHVGFLADRPSKRQVAALDRNRSPGDFFEVRDREIYLFLPNGLGASKLTNAYFDSTLGSVSTFRNWRTVSKLLEMTQPLG